MCTFSFYPGLLINNKFPFLSLYLLLNPKLEKYKCKYKCMIVVPVYLKVRSCSPGGGGGWVVGTLPSVVLSARVSGFWSLGLQLECRPRVVCGWQDGMKLRFQRNKISFLFFCDKFDNAMFQWFMLYSWKWENFHTQTIKRQFVW